MSSIGKLQKFAENKTFASLLEPTMAEVFRRDYKFKGRWKKDIFGNNNPIVLELGCGKGEYTIALAEKYPNKNFIGIDIKGARLWKGAKYAETNKLSNVRFIRTHIDFIESLFGENEIDEIWITFADPQLTHPRKRLSGTLFLERYRNMLSSSGLIHLKTDSIFLHTYTKELAIQNKLNIKSCSTNVYTDVQTHREKDILVAEIPSEVTEIQTFYEKFFLKMGLKITYLSFSLPYDRKVKLVEPEWDVAYWREQEELGRVRKRIQ